MKYITPTVWVLSFVSLLNDVSSEMLYPVMPLFLTSIGFTSVFIGFMEGLAEATAGLSRGYFGRWSDSIGRRLPFVHAGYLMSAVSKPMMAVFTYPWWIFIARTTDRMGKGVRTAARDALLSDESTPENKAKVFGFHKAMDTTGAAIGPALALLFLYFFPGKYAFIFIAAFIPSLLGTLLTFRIYEKKRAVTEKSSFKISQTFSYLTSAPQPYKKVIFALLLFTFFNSSDLFLLMKIKESGCRDEYVIGIYILYNLVFALSAFPLGRLADNIGLRKTLMGGMVIFSMVYLGFAVNTSLFGFIVLFVLYGIYAASSEGVSKALITNIVSKNETASAIGTFSGISAVTAFLASTVAGFIWHFIAPEAVFFFSAAGALSALWLLFRMQVTERN